VILLDDFYKIEQQTEIDSGFEYVISLNKGHSIYKAHFPEKPITPGVCIIQLCKELMELWTGESLFLQKIQNVKFLSIIDPTVTNRVKVLISKVSLDTEGYKCSILIYWETTQFTKLSLYLQHG